MILSGILAGLALVSVGIMLWQWLLGRRFPLHLRVADGSYAPGVTVLKPLKGCDAETRECLRSWLLQKYAGPVQVLFGVASAEDPACAVVRELIQANPMRDAQLVICGDTLGPNAKVSTLIPLQRQAKHDLILVSDADVRVSPDLLANVVVPLREPDVGLVCCFYRMANPTTWAMQWEAIAINADFWVQVLQSQSLAPIDFALGAVTVTRREQLQGIGGFEALVDYLADDFQLGNRIVRAGKRAVFSTVVVDGWDSTMSWRQVWSHQLRWARTFRVCRPLLYFASIIGNATLWPLLWLAARPAAGTLAIVAACLVVRVLTAWANQRRMTEASPYATRAWFAPVKDLLNAGLWATAFLGNHVVWRGERFRVLRGGKLEKE
ncbi:MAG: glycosyltransferase [Verrucomicrobia bacterium]|nr:glycosyltransferase [Verrucomicrobiota bacterium]